MNVRGVSISGLAVRALAFLDTGDLAEVRSLLSTIAASAEEEPTSEISLRGARPDPLVSGAMICILGADISYSIAPPRGWLQHPLDFDLVDDVMSAGFVMRHVSAIIPHLLWTAEGAVLRVPVTIPSQAPNERKEHQDALRFLLTQVRAERSMGEKVYHRILWAAREAGLPQREIAQLVEQPQTMIFRRLKAVDEDPSVLSFGPRELHDAYVAARIDREVFLGLLSEYPYDHGKVAEAELDWSYVPGSWDELSQLAIEGAITSAEFETVLDAVSKRAAAT